MRNNFLGLLVATALICFLCLRVDATSNTRVVRARLWHKLQASDQQQQQKQQQGDDAFVQSREPLDVNDDSAATRVGEEDEVLGAYIFAFAEGSTGDDFANLEKVGLVKYQQTVASTGKEVGPGGGKVDLFTVSVDGVSPWKFNGVNSTIQLTEAEKVNLGRKFSVDPSVITKDNYSPKGLLELITGPVLFDELPLVLKAINLFMNSLSTVASAPTCVSFAPFEQVIEHFNGQLTGSNELAKFELVPDNNDIGRGYAFFLKCTKTEMRSSIQVNYALPLKSFGKPWADLTFKSTGAALIMAATVDTVKSYLSTASYNEGEETVNPLRMLNHNLRNNIAYDPNVGGLFNLMMYHTVVDVFRDRVRDYTRNTDADLTSGKCVPMISARYKNVYDQLPKVNLPDLLRLMKKSSQDQILVWYKKAVRNNEDAVAGELVRSFKLKLQTLNNGTADILDILSNKEESLCLANIKSKLEAARKRLTDSLRKIESDVVRWTKVITSTQTAITKANADIVAKETKLVEAKELCATTEAAFRPAERAFEQLKAEVARAVQTGDDLKVRCDSLEREMKALKNTDVRRADAKLSVDSCKDEKAIATQNLKTLKAGLVKADGTTGPIKADFTKKNTAFDSANKKLRSAEDKLEAAQSELQEQENALEEAQSQLAICNKKKNEGVDAQDKWVSDNEGLYPFDMFKWIQIALASGLKHIFKPTACPRRYQAENDNSYGTGYMSAAAGQGTDTANLCLFAARYLPSFRDAETPVLVVETRHSKKFLQGLAVDNFNTETNTFRDPNQQPPVEVPNVTFDTFVKSYPEEWAQFKKLTKA